MWNILYYSVSALRHYTAKHDILVRNDGLMTNSVQDKYRRKYHIERYMTCLYSHYNEVLVKSFAHLNRNFFLAFLEEIGNTPLCSKLAPLSQGGHKKSIALYMRNF